MFGIYAGFVYIYTGSIWPAIVLHAHCNFYGFPSFSTLVSQDVKRTERIIIGVLYVAGVVVFLTFFKTLTKDVTLEKPWWESEMRQSGIIS